MENKVVGIRFKSAGKKYYFDPINLDLSPGDFVVVETVRGIELGEVIEGIKTIDEKELIATLKPVLRKATQQDILQEEENNKENSHIVSVCKALVKKNTLDMKVLSSEYTLDKSKLIIYFTAEGRIDFRELVKDLANEFKVRIELRQVGARDGAKFLGGIGPCGYLLCCNTFLGEFETVSIKMAKNQNLSLNPSNIS
ncbi:MAG: PSP1 domain-containing protein, partial [Candidatus Izemoplasmataceae bacterium]